MFCAKLGTEIGQHAESVSEQIVAVRLTAKQKYKYPMTEAQNIGWDTDYVILNVEMRLNESKNGSRKAETQQWESALEKLMQGNKIRWFILRDEAGFSIFK